MMDTLINTGDTINFRYRILHQIGHGGFGRTYLAQDINRFNEYCVLKEFAPQLQGSFALKKAQELFKREAGILYRLQHPQIPRFRELFRYKHQGKGRLLIVQDYVEGQTYHTLVNNRSRQGIRFSEAEIRQLLCQLLPVLAYIHSLGVIHRDISPDNLILRSSDGLPVLIDFGSIKEVAQQAQSQLAEELPNLDSLPLIGTVLGKVGYAPPEQIDRGIVRPHSDLYALASTMVVLLTGKKPQQLVTPYSYQWNWQAEVDLSPKLEWILSTMLSPNPLDRFSSATEVIKILQDTSILPSSTNSQTPQLLSNQIQVAKTTYSLTRQRNWLELYLTSKLDCYVKLIFIGMVFFCSYWWWRKQNLAVIAPPISNSHNAMKTDYSLSQRFSQGERLLIPQTTTSEKELGIAAFTQGNYQEAIFLWLASLKKLANDPETLIYLNNARIGAEQSYQIAVSVPIGSDVNASQEILRGVAQAQDRVNQAGGINGIPLKVQIINDDNDPKIGQEIAKNLSQNPEILGVVGHYASDVTISTAKIYQSNQLVSISPVSTSVELSNLSPYLFRTVPSDYIAARALAKYMIEELEQKNVAVFYNSLSNYSVSLQSEFITAVALGGGRVVGTFDLSDPNFSAAQSYNKAVNNGAEVIMLGANTSTLNEALQVVQVNRQRLHLLGGDDVYAPKTLEIGGESAEAMVLAIPWHIHRSQEDEFVRVARQLWGGEVNWRTAMAYDAVKALIAAIELNPTRKGIQQVLSTPYFSTVGACSLIDFLPSGDRLKPIELVTVQPSDRHSFGYEFTPLMEMR